MSVIQFYSVGAPYGEFSNFADFPIKLGGKVWPTSEHYFQAMKFTDPAYQAEIRRTKSPMKAASLRRSRKVPPRKDWESVKDNIMREAVRAKFTQYPKLRELLLGTGEAKLVEHTANDDYWGDGGDGTGKNRLGLILMALRKELAAS